MPTERQLQILEERRKRREEHDSSSTSKIPLAIEGSKFPSFQFQKPLTLTEQDTNANYFYINDTPIWLSQAASHDDHTNQDHMVRTSSSLWDCGVILAKYLEIHPSLVYDKRVIELGAGKALPSIAAAALGARVVITDAKEGLNAAEGVSALNNLQINGRGRGWVESVQSLDWINREKDITNLQNGQFDVVLCSDVVWVEYLVPYLVQTMAELPLAVDAKILFAHQTRSTRIDNLLFEKLSDHGFVLEKIPSSELHPDFRKEAVCLMRIHRA